MTVEELISQLSKYDRDLSVVIVDEYGKPFHVSYCSPQRLDEQLNKFLYLEEVENDQNPNENPVKVISIWPEC